MTKKTLQKYINEAATLDQQVKEMEKTLKAMKVKIIEAMKESNLKDQPTSKFNAHYSYSEPKSIDTTKLKKEDLARWESLFAEYPKIIVRESVKFTAV